MLSKTGIEEQSLINIGLSATPMATSSIQLPQHRVKFGMDGENPAAYANADHLGPYAMRKKILMKLETKPQTIVQNTTKNQRI